MGVRVRELVTCPGCRYQQVARNKTCRKCEASLKGVKRDWYVFVSVGGKRKARCVGSKEAATLVAQKIQAKLSLGELGILDGRPELPTLQEISGRWMEYLRPLRRETTVERYDNVMRLHVLPVFGEREVGSIQRADVKNFLIQKLNAGCARATVDLMRNVLSGAFNYAVDEELIQINPVAGVARRMNIEKDARNTEKEALASGEASLMLETCQKHRAEAFPFFQAALLTGMRLGELLALQWGDVDFHSHFIVVQRTYRRGSFGPPKNGKARRVDMADALERTLRDLLAQRKREGLISGRGDAAELVFCTPAGKPMEQNEIRRTFKKILQKAGLREIRLHSLRHTYASLLLSQGVSPVYVKEQLGHHSIKITVDIYGHWIRSGNRDAVNLLSEQVLASPAQVKKEKARN